MVYEHGDFIINMDIDIVTVHALLISEKINAHASLSLSGICAKANGTMPENKRIVVKSKEGTILFTGMLDRIELKMDKELSNFHLSAFSFSRELDKVKRKRVFQDMSMTYENIIDEVLNSYENAAYIDRATDGAKIAKCIIQYEETDWEFLKRLASHFNTGICVACQAEAIQLFFGKSNEAEEGLNGERLIRNTDLLSRTEQIKMRVDKKLQAGSLMYHAGKRYLVKTVDMIMEKGELIHYITLTNSDNSIFPYIPNQNISGAHIWAFVKEIHRNKLRIQYQIEDKAQGDIPFLSFAGEENNETGFYMPEPDNEVEVTFPDAEEAHAFVSAARRTSGKTNTIKGTVKYLKNKDGLGWQMNRKKINISSGPDNSAVILYRAGSIHIEAPDSICIRTGSDIEIGGRTGKVVVQAGKGITIQGGVTGGSKIRFDTSGNIVCKALQNVLIKGSDTVQSKVVTPQTAVNTGGNKVRSEVLALSGVEFLSQSVTQSVDFQGAQKIMDNLLGRKNTDIESNTPPSDNLIKEKLFQNNERLFNSFCYGESKRG